MQASSLHGNGTSFLTVIMRRGYTRAFFCISPYWLRQLLAWGNSLASQETNLNRCALREKRKSGTGRVAYFRTRAVWGVRETPLDWCFHATCAWRTRISANTSRLAKRPTQLLSQSILKIFAPCAVFLGASKCFHKGGFPVRTGRVAYLSYASGLGVQGNALREVLSRAVRRAL